ncbi:MAG: hypothetical protein ACRBFS_08035 [Aureispira sp.]
MLTGNLKKYKVPSNAIDGSRVYMMFGSPEEDAAKTVPLTVRGERLVPDPFESEEEFDISAASVLKKKGYVVLPASFAHHFGEDDGGSEILTFQVGLEIPNSANLGDGVTTTNVYMGIGETSYVMHNESFAIHEAVKVSGSHNKNTLEVLAQMSMYKTVEVISTQAEATDDDFYNDGGVKYGQVGFDGSSNSQPLYLPFSKEGSENPGLRDEILFGQEGLPRILFNGKQWLKIPLEKGNKVTLRMTIRVSN